MLNVIYTLGFLLYSTSVVLTLATPYRAHDIIEPRYIIEGQPPPPCKNHICPLATSIDSPVEARAMTDPLSSTDPVTPFPRPHQTAPVKCGDTGLPPPCNIVPATYTTNSSEWFVTFPDLRSDLGLTILPNHHFSMVIKCTCRFARRFHKIYRQCHSTTRVPSLHIQTFQIPSPNSHVNKGVSYHQSILLNL